MSGLFTWLPFHPAAVILPAAVLAFALSDRYEVGDDIRQVLMLIGYGLVGYLVGWYLGPTLSGMLPTLPI